MKRRDVLLAAALKIGNAADVRSFAALARP